MSILKELRQNTWVGVKFNDYIEGLASGMTGDIVIKTVNRNSSLVDIAASPSGFYSTVYFEVQNAAGKILSWFQGDVDVSVADTTVGDGSSEIEDAAVTAACVDGVGSVRVIYSDTWQKGISQVETADIVGTITKAGLASCTVTSALLIAPFTFIFEVELGDTATIVAAKLRTALRYQKTIFDNFNIGESTIYVTLTAKVRVADDATLNIAYDNSSGEGACEGITGDATSTTSTNGVAADKQTTTFEATILGYTATPGSSVDAIVD